MLDENSDRKNTAQISAELLVVMAAVVGFALLLIQNISSTSEAAAEKLNESSESLLDEIDNITSS